MSPAKSWKFEPWNPLSWASEPRIPFVKSDADAPMPKGPSCKVATGAVLRSSARDLHKLRAARSVFLFLPFLGGLGGDKDAGKRLALYTKSTRRCLGKKLTLNPPPKKKNQAEVCHKKVSKVGFGVKGQQRVPRAVGSEAQHGRKLGAHWHWLLKVLLGTTMKILEHFREHFQPHRQHLSGTANTPGRDAQTCGHILKVSQT